MLGSGNSQKDAVDMAIKHDLGELYELPAAKVCAMYLSSSAFCHVLYSHQRSDEFRHFPNRLPICIYLGASPWLLSQHEIL
jgi:hypothetical protein